jgi:hypothetical protein
MAASLDDRKKAAMTVYGKTLKLTQQALVVCNTTKAAYASAMALGWRDHMHNSQGLTRCKQALLQSELALLGFSQQRRTDQHAVRYCQAALKESSTSNVELNKKYSQCEAQGSFCQGTLDVCQKGLAAESTALQRCKQEWGFVQVSCLGPMYTAE